MNDSLSAEQHNRLRNALKRGGLRPTRQRSSVYGVILEKPDHPTADEIHLRARAKLPSISLATVYNCLDALVECDLVKQVNLDRSSTRFCPNRKPHAHFRCHETGEVHDVELDQRSLAFLENLLPEGFVADMIDLSFAGRGPGDKPTKSTTFFEPSEQAK